MYTQPIRAKANRTLIVAASALLYTGSITGAIAQPQEVRTSDAEKSIDTVFTSSPNCVVDRATKRWLRFQNLVDEWQRERGAMSSITEMSMLTPYQNIIGMGVDALPLILTKLKAEGDDPDQWFWALLTISEANDLNPPQIGEEDRGDFRKMAQIWLEWGKSQGYAG
jgi:hypothetical protein